MQAITCSMQAITCSMQAITCSMQAITCSMEAITCSVQTIPWTGADILSFGPVTSYEQTLNSLSPVWCQDSAWTIADILSLGTNFSEICIQTSSIVILTNVFENAVCKISAILFSVFSHHRSRCITWHTVCLYIFVNGVLSESMRPQLSTCWLAKCATVK